MDTPKSAGLFVPSTGRIGNHVSLFAGIGATDIAVEAFGYETVATAEIDPWCRKLLAKRFPGAIHLSDVRDVTPESLPISLGKPLLISGGFPCQDISALGNGSGIDGKRSSLWSEFARIIYEFKPDKVLIENSPMLRTRGLATILGDLAVRGYDARWDCIPAASVGAPHLRDRMFIVSTPCLHGFRFPSLPWELPRAGMMRYGKITELSPLARIKDAKKMSVAPRMYPTPRRAPNEWRTTKNAPTHGKGHGKTLAGEVNDLERAAGRTPAPSSESAGNINPEWVEWVMGLPQGWTDQSKTNIELLKHSGWRAEPVIPRTIASPPDRRSRLQALGNSLVPQAALVALTSYRSPEEP